MSGVQTTATDPYIDQLNHRGLRSFLCVNASCFGQTEKQTTATDDSCRQPVSCLRSRHDLYCKSISKSLFPENCSDDYHNN